MWLVTCQAQTVFLQAAANGLLCCRACGVLHVPKALHVRIYCLLCLNHQGPAGCVAVFFDGEHFSTDAELLACKGCCCVFVIP